MSSRSLCARLFLVLLGVATLWQTAFPCAAEEPRVRPRCEWNARPWIPEKMRAQLEIKGIIVHHSEGSTPNPDQEARVIAGIQQYHMDEKKWGDLAYHLFICPSGHIYQGRPLEFAGDTATAYDTQGYELICFLGSYQEVLPTPEAREAFHWLVRGELRRLKLSADQVVGHRDVASTDCPGNTLYKWFKEEFKPSLSRMLLK